MHRDKNPVTKELVSSLEKRNQVWKAVARGLRRTRRKRFEVSVAELDRFAGDTIVVPGKVLGSGEVKKVTVAALGFSSTAREKIIKAGGNALSIQELLEKNPEGKGVRIVG